LRVVAGVAIVVIAALTAWSDETDQSSADQPTPVRKKAQPSRVEDLDPPGPSEFDLFPPSVPATSRKRIARNRTGVAYSEAAPVENTTTAGHRRNSARAGIVQATFQPSLSPIPDTGPGLTARPFRKIADIIPYDNYEPDPELAAKDPCANICPRPQGGDCPDCSKDGEGNMIPCPECPWEQELRRIGRAPGEPDREFVPRDFAHIHYCWEPTNLYHNPIYFEDVALERYGHTRHYIVQPVFSAVKFTVQLLGLPYQMSIYPVWDRQYSLGYYRPGEFVPYRYQQIPLNAKAAVVEAGWVAGGYFLFAPGVGP
jgi:hypothetical protein